MQNNQAIKEKLVSIYYKFNYILEFLLSIPLAIFILRLVYDKEHTGLWFFGELFPACIFGILVIAIIITNVIKHKDKLEKMFITFVIPIGMMYAIYIIPTYVPDENAHLIRNYLISIGHFIEFREDVNNASIAMPENLSNSTLTYVKNYANLFEKIHGNNDYSNIEVSNDKNAAENYFPTVYVFSALGIFIGRTLLLNPIITMYLAKILNFIAYLILGYYSIKKIPFGKVVVLTYLFLPMVLQQAISMSADSLTNGVAIFFIAYSLYILKRDTVMSKKEEIFYYFLVAFVAISKFVYMPLVVISWLLFANKNYSKKQKWRIVLISTILGVVLSLSWYVYSSINYPDVRDYIDEHGINGTEQLKYILTHPLEYLQVIQNTLDKGKEDYLYTFVGKCLGWLNINIDMIVIIGFIILGVFSPFLTKDDKTLNWKERLWFCFIFAGIFLLIFTGMYMVWTTVGADRVDGVQGRYFIPIGILLLLCLCSNKRFLEFKNVNVAYPVMLCLLNFCVLDTVVHFFIA